MGDITCIFFVPMSTIVDHWSKLVPPPVARGAYVTHAPIPPPGGALIGCAHSLAVGDIRVVLL